MTDPGRAIPRYPAYRITADGTIRRATDGARIQPVNDEVTLIDPQGRFHRHPMTELMQLLSTAAPTTEDDPAMATKIVDDLDNHSPAETVPVSIGADHYEIDLSPTNLQRLRDAVDPFLQAGRKVERRTTLTGRRDRTGESTAQRARNAAIREWARANGYDLAERGRLPQHVVDAYNTAHQAQRKRAATTAHFDTPAPDARG